MTNNKNQPPATLPSATMAPKTSNFILSEAKDGSPLVRWVTDYNIIIFDHRHLMFWLPPFNYMAAAT